MAVIAADLESRLTELCEGAFEAFCDDISSMFDADIRCKREHSGFESLAALRKRFKKLAAVHLVKATGTVDGTFQLLFDQGGLFVLSGVVVMLPEARILEQARNGHMDDAESLTDAAREVGNLLVGSWDRVFRDDCEGHGHFVKSGTYIGKPWDHLDEIGLADDEEVLLQYYEMTVDSFPAFHCAALFPKALVGEGAGTTAEATEPAAAEPAAAEPAAAEPAATEPAAAEPATSEPAPAVQPPEPAEAAASPVQETAPPQETSIAPPVDVTPAPSASPEPERQGAVVSDRPDSTEAPATVSGEKPPAAAPAVVSTSDAADVDAAVVPTAVPADETPSQTTLGSTIGILSDERAAALIDQVFEEHAVHPSDTGISDLLRIPARDIMTKEVVWCAPEDAVQEVLAAMQQHNAGYVLVGRDGMLEGLVSNSNILGAISPYLRPTFAKWRRPEDDATLGIKIKWIMSRPVRTVKPDVPFATIIENMRRYGGRCVPVADGQGKVLGIITVFDLLLRVLEADGSSSWQGSPPQGPPLLI